MKKGEIHERQSFEAGKVFIKQGEEGHYAYLIQSGSARVFTEVDGEKVELAVLEAGALVGEAALITNEPRGASVEAIDVVTAVVITREDFELKLLKSDATIRSVLKLLSERMGQQNDQVVSQYGAEDDFDADAAAIVESFSRKMGAERKAQFQKEILPHMTSLITALKDFKSS